MEKKEVGGKVGLLGGAPLLPASTAAPVLAASVTPHEVLDEEQANSNASNSSSAGMAGNESRKLLPPMTSPASGLAGIVLPHDEDPTNNNARSESIAVPQDALCQAQALLRTGVYDEALALASATVGSDNSRAWLTVRYGCYVRQRNFPAALKCLEQRIELNPLDVEAYNLMGMIHLQHTRSPGLARACFQAVLSLSPWNPVAKSGLSACSTTDLTN